VVVRADQEALNPASSALMIASASCPGQPAHSRSGHDLLYQLRLDWGIRELQRWRNGGRVLLSVSPGRFAPVDELPHLTQARSYPPSAACTMGITARHTRWARAALCVPLNSVSRAFGNSRTSHR
jgi:hypothetical protein